MTRRDSISPRQFVAAVFVSALSLLIRRFPRALAALAGRSAVLAVPASVLPMLALLAAIWLLARRRSIENGIPDLLSGLLGRTAARAVIGVYGLWFLFYAGFLLRSGAERFLTTVYPGAQPWLFVCLTALLCAPAAGRLTPLARAAMIIRPLMLGLILCVAVLTAKDLDPALLLPLRPSDPPGVWISALEIANLLSVAVFFGFVGNRLERPLHLRDWAPWLAALLGIIALMTAQCVGMFGQELTAKMRYPYFMLVRDLTVLGALERLEPVVIALWVFSDFILISMLLHLAAGNLRAAVGARRAGRRAAPLCAAAAAVLALLLPGAMGAQEALSDKTVPLLCALFAFGPLPVLLLVSALRKKQ